jgi:hypothetical protein
MDIEKAKRAMINAHKAGDTAAAQRMADLIKRHQSQPQQPNENPSIAADVGTQFFENFNRGAYSTANAPTAIANLALAGVDKVAEQFGGNVDYRFKRPLEAIAPALDAVPMTVPEAKTKAGEFAGVVGEYTGANVLPAAGVMAAAPKVAAMTQGAQKVGGQLANSMARSITNAPGKAAIGELGATLGAGTGAAIGRGASDGDPTAEFIGATLGGMAAPFAPMASPMYWGRKGYQYVKPKISRENTDRVIKNSFSKHVKKNLTPDAIENVRKTQDIQKDIPDYKPSAAEATESPALMATQEAFERSMAGDALNAAVKRRAANETAAMSARDRLRPASRLTPDNAFRSQVPRLNRVQSRIGDGLDDLSRREFMIGEDLQSGGRRNNQGASIRDELLNERARVKEEMSITAREMGLNDNAAQFDFRSAKEPLKQSVQPRSDLADRSAIPNRILADIDAKGDNASIVDMMELRSRISADIREAKSTPSGQKRVPYLEKLKSAVDEQTDAMIARTDDPGLADKLREFRDTYRRDYIEPFETGAAGQVLRKDIDGMYRVNDEEVAKQFFKGWNQTAAEQFQKVFKNSPAAQRAISDAAIDDLYNSAATDGILDPLKMESWARANRGVIADFPEIRNRLGNTQKALSEIAARRKVLKQRQKMVEQTALARDLKRINDPITGITGESIIDGAISPNPGRMQNIARMLKGEEARNALSARVWDRVIGDKNPSKFFEDNAASIRVALGEEKAKSAERIVTALRKNAMMRKIEGQAIDPNPVGDVEAILGSSFASIGSKLYQARVGFASPRYVAMDLASRTFRHMSGQRAISALQEAIYDPEAALIMAKTIQEPVTVTSREAARLYTYLLSSGVLAGAHDAQPNQR